MELMKSEPWMFPHPNEYQELIRKSGFLPEGGGRAWRKVGRENREGQTRLLSTDLRLLKRSQVYEDCDNKRAILLNQQEDTAWCHCTSTEPAGEC